MQKTLHSLDYCAENFPLIQISSILSVNFTSLCHKCQRVFWWASCTSARNAGSFDCLMTSLILITMDNGRGHCILTVMQSSQPNPQRNKKMWKMYAIKQIKICAEYRDMLPRPRLDLSGTPGLRPIGLSPGSWQTSLGLGSISWYSAQILICITNSMRYSWYVLASSNGKFFPRYWSFVRVIHRWIPFTKASDAELWCFFCSVPWINGWVNNCEADDLRPHRAHYDVIVMKNTAQV